MHTDIQVGSPKKWVFRATPKPLWPYVLLGRWDRPIGVWLLLWPAYWGLALGQIDSSLIHQFFLFLGGAIFMRGSGCTLNDILDRDVDAHVERTKFRPLPQKMISTRQALLFLLLQLGGAALVFLWLTPLAKKLALGSCLFVCVYPLMKRITSYPQLFLGFTFNAGIFVGGAQRGVDDVISQVVLYLVGIFWTLCYDTIYACQDRDDDIVAGVKSLAVHLGKYVYFFSWCCLGAMAAILGLLGIKMQFAASYYFISGLACFYLGYGLLRVRINDKLSCLKFFRSSHWFGLLLLMALLWREGF